MSDVSSVYCWCDSLVLAVVLLLCVVLDEVVDSSEDVSCLMGYGTVRFGGGGAPPIMRASRFILLGLSSMMLYFSFVGCFSAAEYSVCFGGLGVVLSRLLSEEGER